jgi:hypothetical protein
MSWRFSSWMIIPTSYILYCQEQYFCQRTSRLLFSMSELCIGHCFWLAWMTVVVIMNELVCLVAFLVLLRFVLNCFWVRWLFLSGLIVPSVEYVRSAITQYI